MTEEEPQLPVRSRWRRFWKAVLLLLTILAPVITAIAGPLTSWVLREDKPPPVIPSIVGPSREPDSKPPLLTTTSEPPFVDLLDGRISTMEPMDPLPKREWTVSE